MTVGVARACPLFTVMADRLTPFSVADAKALKAMGFGAVGQYVEALTPAARDGIWSAGLAILPLSEAPLGVLSATTGHSLATNILSHTKALGVATGVHMMLDFEAQQGDATDHGTAASGDLAGAGFIPLGYVGAGQLLSGHALYEIPAVHLYWRGGSLGVAEPDCGFAVWQNPTAQPRARRREQPRRRQHGRRRHPRSVTDPLVR